MHAVPKFGCQNGSQMSLTKSECAFGVLETDMLIIKVLFEAAWIEVGRESTWSALRVTEIRLDFCSGRSI